MIISLRGTNGSGKTTVVRELMARSRTKRPIYGILGPRYPESYQLDVEAHAPLFVLGPYTTPSACGMDGITNYDVGLDLVRKYAAKGHVLFEGLIVGKLWGRMGALLEELSPVHGAVLLYLSTTLEECIDRVVERRRRAGDVRPFNEKNLRAVYGQVRSNLEAVRKKQVVGLRIEEAASLDAPDLVLRVFEGRLTHGSAS